MLDVEKLDYINIELSYEQLTKIIKDSLIPRREYESDITYEPSVIFCRNIRLLGIHNISKNVIKEDSILTNGQKATAYRCNNGMLIKEIIRNPDGTISRLTDTINREVSSNLLKLNGRDFNKDEFKDTTNQISTDTEKDGTPIIIESIKIDHNIRIKTEYKKYINDSGKIDFDKSTIKEWIIDDKKPIHFISRSNYSSNDNYEIQLLQDDMQVLIEAFSLDGVEVPGCTKKMFSKRINGKLTRLHTVATDRDNNVIAEGSTKIDRCYCDKYTIIINPSFKAYNRKGKSINPHAAFKYYKNQLLGNAI